MKLRLLIFTPIILLLSWPGWGASAAKKSNRGNLTRFQAEAVRKFSEMVAASKIPDATSAGSGSVGRSPDGTKLATYVAGGDHVGRSLFVVLYSAGDYKFLRKLNLGPEPEATLSESLRIVFSGDGKYLLASDWKAIHVLDASTLSEVRTITAPAGSGFTTPSGMVVASNADVAAIDFGKGACLGPLASADNGRQDQIVDVCPCVLKASLVGEDAAQQAATIGAYWGYQTKRHVHVRVVDFATGKELGSWNASDYPFSISPNGKYVAVSDHTQEGTVLGVDILDARTGTQVGRIVDENAKLKVTAWSKVYGGRLIAKFLRNHELVVTGEGNRPNGHYVVDYVRIVQFKPFGGDRIVQEFRPKHYGPMDVSGFFEVSGDGNTFTIWSDYWPPKYFKHDIAPPQNQATFVFHRQADGLFEFREVRDHPK